MTRDWLFGSVKIGLIVWGGISLFALPFAGLFIAEWIRGSEAREEIAIATTAAVPLDTMALPRMRPHEPLVTGSISRQYDELKPAIPRPIRASLGRDLLADSAAVMACEDGVREGLALPNELSRVISSTKVDRAPGEHALVSFAFDTLNGFGFPQTLTAHCVFDGRRLARLEIEPR